MIATGDSDIFPAGANDSKILARHHRLMFQEIWDESGLVYRASDLDLMEQAYHQKLQKELETENCSAWVIRTDKCVAASGAISVLSMVPVPNDPSCQVAYLHSIYTEREYRGKGFAGRLVDRAIVFCKDNGIKRIFLNASSAGRHLYEKVGFQLADNAMRLLIP